MATTKSAGRVSIRVVPDSTRFKEDLKRSLERIENSMVVKIRAELNLDRESLIRLKREIEALVIRIRPNIEVSQSDIASMRAEIERTRPRVVTDLDTREAARRMAALARTRRAKIQAEVEYEAEVSRALARIRAMFNRVTMPIRTKVMALGGFNVVLDTMREGAQFIENLDRNAVKYAQMATKIGSMVSAVGATLGSAAAIAGDLVAAGGVGWLAPAFLTGTAIGVGVLVAAMKDMGTVLADLKPKFAAWQDSISADFWKEAADPIRKMVDHFLPLLNTTDSGTNTAKSLGKFFAEMANSMTEIVTKDKLNLMLDRMNNSIDILRGSIRPMTHAFTELGIVGSGYFERFSRWIVDLSTRFDNFITQAAADGRLDRWIENSITTFKELGSIIKSTWGIFKSLDAAATSAGSMNLAGFTEMMRKISETMNGERFQASLTAFFRGANAAVKGLVDGFIRLGPAVESFMPTFERSMGSLGQILGKLLDFVGIFLSNKDMQKGIEDLFGGLSKALDNLKPAIDPMATSLGGLFSLMGEILPNIASIVGSIAIHLGPVFDKFLASIKPLIPPLTEMILKLIPKLAPLLDQFVTEIMPPLIDLAAELLPLITDIVALLTPVLVATISYIAQGLKKMADGMKAFNEWAKPGREALEKFTDTANKFKLPSFGNLAADIGVKFGVALGVNNPSLAPIFRYFLNDNLFIMAKNVKTFTDGILSFFSSPINTAIKFGASLGDSPLVPVFNKFLGNNLLGFANSIKPFAEGVAKLFTPEGLTEIAIGIVTGFTNFFAKLPQALEIIWKTFWHKVKKDFQKWFKDTFGFGGTDNLDDPAKIINGGGLGPGGKGRAPGATILPSIIDEESEMGFMDGFKTKIDAKFGGLFTGIGIALDLFKTTKWTPGWTGLLGEADTGTTNTTTNIGLTFATKFAEWGLGFETFKTNALVTWGIWGSETLKTAQDNMGGADTTITEKTGNMAVTIATWVATNQPIWTTAFNVMKQHVVDNMTGSNDSTTTNLATMSATVATKLSEIKTNWSTGWDVVKATLVTAWNIMTGQTQRGVQDNANEAGKLPEKAKTAIGPTQGTLLSSGMSLVAGFAEGMRRNIPIVTSAAIAVAAEVAKHMPHSPAKEGPLSGLGYTTHSGRALVSDFAGGMMDNMRKVRDAAAQVAGAAALDGSYDVEYGSDENGLTIDRSQTIIQTYNPVAEPTSRTIEASANKLRMLKGK